MVDTLNFYREDYLITEITFIILLSARPEYKAQDLKIKLKLVISSRPKN